MSSAKTLDLSVLTTEVSDWTYVSEGGATIVYSYIGQSDPSFSGTVLRLRKTRPNNSAVDIDEECGDEPDDPSIAFQHRIMSRLIPEIHLPRLEPVLLDRKWLEAFVALHDEERPAKRRAVGGVDLSRKKGVSATDLVGGNTGAVVAVEIKPKWSFLPNPRFLSPQTKAIKGATCRFCMHADLKSDLGHHASVGYCPLDLFSTNATRVRTAVYSLYDAWIENRGQANNLKVFIRGKTVVIDQWRSILAPNYDNLTKEELREAFADAMVPLLIRTPVLQVLNKLQRTLDLLDIEGLSQLWNAYQSSISAESTVIAENEADPDLEEWESFISSYLGPDSVLDATSPKPEHVRTYLLAYVLSATFKDCSLMVRMDRIGRAVPASEAAQREGGVANGALHEEIVDPGNGELIAVAVDPSRVTLIDLDLKGMERLRKWEALDKEIVRAYSTVDPSERRTCIDDWKD